ncbi:MAG: hypothetical protein ABL907_10560 [Hyphomicrobium sp.]
MAELIYWIVLMCVVAAAGLAGVVGVRAYLNGTSPGDLLFKPRAEPRIGVIEQANVDGRRRLLLIRRDDIEHLIMTGGPVDVVVETGIGEKRTRSADPQAATVFTRQPRGFGPAASGGETS